MTRQAASGDASLAEAILIPKVADINRMPKLRGRTAAWVDVTQTVAIEWTLLDLRGEIVWIDTAVGQFKNTSGTLFSFDENAQERLQNAIDLAFEDSTNRMAKAQEIQVFVEARGES